MAYVPMNAGLQMVTAIALIGVVLLGLDETDDAVNPFLENLNMTQCTEGINSKLHALILECDSYATHGGWIGTIFAFLSQILWMGTTGDSRWIGAITAWYKVECFLGIMSFIIYSVLAATAEWLQRWWRRLSLTRGKRDHRIQCKKRWSNKQRQTCFVSKLNRRGLIFALLLSGCSVSHAMDADQFNTFMRQFGQMVVQNGQQSQATLQGISNLAQSIAGVVATPSGATGSTASEASSINRNFESAARILKTPEFFDASDTVEHLASFICELAFICR